jgi:hypothetical protein
VKNQGVSNHSLSSSDFPAGDSKKGLDDSSTYFVSEGSERLLSCSA